MRVSADQLSAKGSSHLNRNSREKHSATKALEAPLAAIFQIPPSLLVLAPQLSACLGGTSTKRCMNVPRAEKKVAPKKVVSKTRPAPARGVRLTLSAKAAEIHRRLQILHADAHIELDFSNSLELLVATILSAQCTDVRVNIVTKQLFKVCRTASDYAECPIEQLEELIRSTGFFRNKARNIQAMARRLVEQFHGEVPNTMEELVGLPGVGRKTANVVLGNAFDLPGLPVDTHVTRLSRRIGLTKRLDAVQIESELCGLLPESAWCLFSHELIFHGRRICKARKPQCAACPLTDLCTAFQRGDFDT